MMNTKSTFIKKAFPIIFLLIDVALIYFTFFYADIKLDDKLFLLIILELSLPTNIFIASVTFNEMNNHFKMFFKSSKSKILIVLIFANIDFLIVSVVFGILISLLYLIGVAIPLLYLIIILLLWRYCNYDSEKIKPKPTNKYLGIGISNHYVFDGVDVLAEKNHKKAKIENIKMINPFNRIYSYTSQEIFYVTGKDYKFYISTVKLNELFTLVYLVRNKDAVRCFLNKHIKEDFELNKNIYTAYCLNQTQKDEDFIYAEQSFRYKIYQDSGNFKVQIEQKTELPHLTTQNGISNWFGDILSFKTEEEAKRFVKFVIEQTKNGSFDAKF